MTYRDDDEGRALRLADELDALRGDLARLERYERDLIAMGKAPAPRPASLRNVVSSADRPSEPTSQLLLERLDEAGVQSLRRDAREHLEALERAPAGASSPNPLTRAFDSWGTRGGCCLLICFILLIWLVAAVGAGRY